MPRRRSPEKRKVLPDPKYKDVILAKFMNNLMKDGKKSVAEKIVYGAFDQINKNSKEDPLGIFMKALEEVSPVVEVKSRRVGGSTYQVPIEIRAYRGTNISLRWINEAAKERSYKVRFTLHQLVGFRLNKINCQCKSWDDHRNSQFLSSSR